MAETPSEYLDRVTARFAAEFAPATVTLRDERSDRHLLEMWGEYGSYRVRLLEVVAAGAPRKYAYYVLQDDRVIVGFDNAPDPHVRRLKHGADHAAHLRERIPHRHTANKSLVELTEEMDCAQFAAWVKANPPRD